ncbi:hypothetical protein EON65_29510 [archaeon]|nr:MAG: hypothetical protein EON65_29510 [archaeon]
MCLSQRCSREDLDFQIKQLNLPDDPVPASTPATLPSSNAHHLVGNRRRPILHSMPSSLNIMSSDSVHEYGAEESPMHHYSSNYVSNMNRFMNSSGGPGGLNSSFGGFNAIGGGTNSNRRHSKSNLLVRKHSFNSVASNSQDDTKDHGKWINASNNSQDVFNSDMRLPSKRTFQKKGNMFKSSNRLGGYSLITLGVVDRLGSSDPDLGIWLKKVRSTTMNLKLHELLRGILVQQRRKYLNNLNDIRLQRKLNPVNVNEVVAFLRNPSDYSKAKSLSEMVNVKYNASSLPDLVYE